MDYHSGSGSRVFLTENTGRYITFIRITFRPISASSLFLILQFITLRNKMSILFAVLAEFLTLVSRLLTTSIAIRALASITII
jgi:hypothetical protein